LCNINPKIPNSNYPFKHIAGCVVALKLSQALVFSFSSKEYEQNIVLCFSQKIGEDFSGSFVNLKNGLEIKKSDFKSIYETKSDIKDAFKIYVNSSELKVF
jgi:single-stranded DNA-specific DHH superfamily exonuclease